MSNFDNDKDRMTYAMALNLATSVRHIPVELNWQLLGTSIAELLNGGEPRISQAEYGEYMGKLQKKLKQAEESAAAADGKATEEEEKFMTENGKKDGVVTTASSIWSFRKARGKSVPVPAMSSESIMKANCLTVLFLTVPFNAVSRSNFRSIR